VVVVGGGPAGLAAAAGAVEGGAGRVVIVERDRQLGGILQQCIHTGFGVRVFREELTGPEYAQRYIDKVRSLGVEVLTNTMVLKITPDRHLWAVSREGILEIESGAVVLAMGCRERTRGAIGVPGTRPAGIYTAGTAQRLVNVEGLMPGRRVVILGSGDIGMIMARRLTLEGAEVKAVVEMLPYAGGLARNVVQCLNDFDIPLLLQHTVTEIHGRRRVEGVTVARLGPDQKPLWETARRMECDTLLLSVGLIPENELSKSAGVALDPATGGPVVNEMMETSVHGIFAGGNVVQVHDLVDEVSVQSEKAGRSAALFAMGLLPGGLRRIPVKAGRNIRLVVPQFVRTEGIREPLEFNVRVAEPERDVAVTVFWGAGSFRQRKPIVRPGEMLKIRVPTGVVERHGFGGADSVTVAAEGVGT